MNTHRSSSNPFRGRGLSIHIPTPCHENWDAMTPVQQGRFCQSCAKQVVDFSLMTDQEVLNYFNKNTGNTCGRFNNDQLQRPLQPTKQEKKKARWVAMLLPAFMLFQKAKAQGMVTVMNKPKSANNYKFLLQNKNHVPGQKIIYGRVINAEGQAIPFASISLNGKYGGVYADSIGAFNISVPANNFSTLLDVSAIGYNNEKVFLNGDTAIYTITLKQTENALAPVAVVGYAPQVRRNVCGGAISVIEVTKTSIVDTLRNLVSPAFKIFPNPVPRGGIVNIDVKNEGNYSIQLFDNTGRLISANTFQSIKGAKQTQVTISSSATAGMYYIRLVDEKKKKQYTDKLIVM